MLYQDIEPHHNQPRNAIFITFPGNCKKALTFYQTCFGGLLQFETFKGELTGHMELPVISGSLIADQVVIHGSDLVHSEGRRLGNYMAIFLHCKNAAERTAIIERLASDKNNVINDDGQKLIELTDAFDVRWIIGI